jgi:hypothetical protein
LKKAQLTWSLAASALAAVGLGAACPSTIIRPPDNNPPAPDAGPSPAPPAPVVDSCNDAAKLDPAYSTAILNPSLPCDRGPLASAPAGDGTRQIQIAFNHYSWMTFAAMNWPLLPDGKPDTAKKIGDVPDGPVAWESWKESYEIFNPEGTDPGPFDAPRVAPAACNGKASPDTRVLRQISKSPRGVLDEAGQPLKSGPLIDQQGVFTRFSILVNRAMFDYIRDNQLYGRKGQDAFGGPALFPCGFNSGNAKAPSQTPSLGPIMLKASWKILDPQKDDASRFHVAKMLVYTPANDDPKIDESCELATVGLVGLHVVHKTASAPQWIWSSFEQVDNAPDEGDVKSNKLKAHYNYFTPGCADCAAHNEPPPTPWDPNKHAQPSQIVRLTSIPDLDQDAPPVNALYQAAVKNSVWSNYQLLSAQWPSVPFSKAFCKVNPLDIKAQPIPQFLANATMESFAQGRTPGASSSCIDCHANAASTTAKGADFTFLLQRAR